MEVRATVTALVLGLCCACPPNTLECQQDSDCRAREVCHQSICRQVCNSSAECRRDELCHDGVCLPAVYDAATIDVAAPDRAVLDSTSIDGAVADAGPRDTGQVDLVLRDTNAHDTALNDAASPDSSAPDSSAPDTRGSCLQDEDCSYLNAPCLVGGCDIASGSCETRPDLGAQCDDGFDCTDGDQCDPQGACVGTPSDARCPSAGQLCMPGCFDQPSGCGHAPAQPMLSCTAPVDDLAGTKVTCTLDLAEALPDQRACLSCSAKGGFVLLDHTDFLDQQNRCSLDGWQLGEGESCNASVSSCVPSGALEACCAEIDTICEQRPSSSPDTWLKSEMVTNCGGGYRGWKITRSFDLSGLGVPTLCYDVAEAYATGADAVFATVKRPSTDPEQLSCTSGDVDWRAGFQTSCALLPAWAAGEAAVQVTLAAHSSATDQEHRMRLDNIYLYAFHDSCAPASVLLLEEDFSGCDDPIADDWNGWSVTGAARCSTTGCDTGGESAFAQDSASFTITHYVDTREVSGAVQLCLRAGDEDGSSSDALAVSFDLGDGAGWRYAAWGSMYRAPDHECQQVCFNLSAVDPRVAHNPNLGIRVHAASDADWSKTIVDDIVLHGVRNCEVDQTVSVSPLSAVGSSTYELEVTHASAGPPVVELSCGWGDVSLGVEAFTEIDFR